MVALNLDSEGLHVNVDGDQLLSSFMSTCTNILDQIAPPQTMCPKRKSVPWLNESKRALVRHKKIAIGTNCKCHLGCYLITRN